MAKIPHKPGRIPGGGFTDPDPERVVPLDVSEYKRLKDLGLIVDNDPDFGKNREWVIGDDEETKKKEKEAEEKKKKEQEAKEKAEKAAREKAEKEAKEKAEKEAKEKAEKEAKEKLIEQAKEKIKNDVPLTEKEAEAMGAKGDIEKKSTSLKTFIGKVWDKIVNSLGGTRYDKEGDSDGGVRG